jgi:outer membrane protein OmpA-like peptidoglycan-associated protein
MKSMIRSLAGVCVLALAACATTPERVDELEQARSAVQTLEREQLAQSVAATPLSRARQALSRADAAHENGEPLPEIRHEAYMARRHAEIGMAMVQEAQALESIKAAEAERRAMQLEARTQEAERAQTIAREQTAEARQQTREAQRSRAAAEEAREETERLQQELSDLEAEQTERGIVLTLSDDVMFATDSAELRSGAYRAIDRLAEFLQQNPERRLLIEGHTDARGAESYNEDLSARRANSVAEALMQRGIATDRLRPIGLGEAYPVASNETSVGQQENRRVEVVISDDDGSFPEAADRTLARRQGSQ